MSEISDERNKLELLAIWLPTITERLWDRSKTCDRLVFVTGTYNERDAAGAGNHTAMTHGNQVNEI
jgi:hypothetical protein